MFLMFVCIFDVEMYEIYVSLMHLLYLILSLHFYLISE